MVYVAHVADWAPYDLHDVARCVCSSVGLAGEERDDVDHESVRPRREVVATADHFWAVKQHSTRLGTASSVTAWATVIWSCIGWYHRHGCSSILCFLFLLCLSSLPGRAVVAMVSLLAWAGDLFHFRF